MLLRLGDLACTDAVELLASEWLPLRFNESLWCCDTFSEFRFEAHYFMSRRLCCFIEANIEIDDDGLTFANAFFSLSVSTFNNYFFASESADYITLLPSSPLLIYLISLQSMLPFAFDAYMVWVLFIVSYSISCVLPIVLSTTRGDSWVVSDSTSSC